MLPDADYDCVVIDVAMNDDDVALELAITSGAAKGDVVRVRSDGVHRDPLELLGLPATLRVSAGIPSVHFDA